MQYDTPSDKFPSLQASAMSFDAEIDEIFGYPKQKIEKPSSEYDVQLCTPKWFLECDLEGNNEEVLNSLHHKADVLYYQKLYSEASALYEKCLKLVPVNSSARREVMENLSKSFLKNGDPEKALEWALKMHASAVSPDQKNGSWNLLATICHKLGKYEEELEALHCCLESHKSLPDLWFRLAYCYAGLFQISLPNSNLQPRASVPCCCQFRHRTKSVGRHVGDTCVSIPCQCLNTSPIVPSCRDSNTESNLMKLEECNQPNSEIGAKKCEMCDLGVQIISACLIRTRLLMENLDEEHLNPVKNHLKNEEVTQCLSYLEVDQPFIDEATMMLKSELFNRLPGAKDSQPLSLPCPIDGGNKGNGEESVMESMKKMSL